MVAFGFPSQCNSSRMATQDEEHEKAEKESSFAPHLWPLAHSFRTFSTIERSLRALFALEEREKQAQKAKQERPGQIRHVILSRHVAALKDPIGTKRESSGHEVRASSCAVRAAHRRCCLFPQSSGAAAQTAADWFWRQKARPPVPGARLPHFRIAAKASRLQCLHGV